MDGPTIFHLDFVQILEEVADYFHLEPRVISTSSSGGRNNPRPRQPLGHCSTVATVYKGNATHAQAAARAAWGLSSPLSPSALRMAMARMTPVHMQVTPHDPGAYTTFYGYGEDDHEAGFSVAHEALKSLYFSLNFGLVDLHTYEYWENLLDLARSE